MGRPIGTGLGYFPFDVDFFEDEKMEFISARFGLKGEAITIRILCKIFREGYYINWNEDTALLFSRRVGDGCQYTLVNDVVLELLRREFFNRDIFERFGVLTSNGIQKRYIKICKDSKRIGHKIKPEYRINGFPPEETPLIPEETPLIPEFSTQRKEKKSKEKNIECFDFLELVPEDLKTLPDFVEDWLMFVKHRQEKKKPLTRQSAILNINRLVEFKQKGQNLNLVIRKTIMNSWQSFYEIKQNDMEAQQPQNNKSDPVRQTDSSFMQDFKKIYNGYDENTGKQK